MLGELLGETRGKRIVRRMLSSEPVKVEVSFEDSGQMLGVDVTGFGTYCADVRSDGTMYGEGDGTYISAEGEMVTWKGSGLGRFKEGGAVSYRGILYFRTASQKLARLNTVAGVFEYEVDGKGATHSKVWEWK
jgi:hypothetical protein